MPDLHAVLRGDLAGLETMLDAIEFECRKLRALGSSMRLLADDVQMLEATLDRLTTITVDEVAAVIVATPSPTLPSGIATVWHGLPLDEVSEPSREVYRRMATAVLALLKDRMGQ